MDDTTAHRKKRLQALIDGKPFLGNQSAFAEKAGRSKGYITQLLDPDVAFGERAAMNMAAKLGLKDERYFERSDGAPPVETAHPTTRLEPDDVMGALGILATTLQTSDKATRSAVAASFSLLATEPDQLENVIATLEKLLPRTKLARASQDDPQEAREITALLPTIASKENKSAKRSSVQGGGRT